MPFTLQVVFFEHIHCLSNQANQFTLAYKIHNTKLHTHPLITGILVYEYNIFIFCREALRNWTTLFTMDSESARAADKERGKGPQSTRIQGNSSNIWQKAIGFSAGGIFL